MVQANLPSSSFCQPVSSYPNGFIPSRKAQSRLQVCQARPDGTGVILDGADWFLFALLVRTR